MFGFVSLRFLLLAILVGGIAGWACLIIADWLLKYKQRQFSTYFAEMVGECNLYRAEHDGDMPTVGEPGVSRECALWFEDAVVHAHQGFYTRDELDALARLGADVEGCPVAAPDLYSLRVPMWGIVVTVLSMAALFAMIVCVPVSSLFEAFWAAFACIAFIGALCDVKARVIPGELCAVLLGCACIYQVLCFGWQALGYALLLAVCVTLACWLISLIFAHFGKKQAFGHGDLRYVFCICAAVGLPGVVIGAFAAAVVCGIFMIVSFVARRLKFGSYVPMAAFFAIWLVVGIIWPVAGTVSVI